MSVYFWNLDSITRIDKYGQQKFEYLIHSVTALSVTNGDTFAAGHSDGSIR